MEPKKEKMPQVETAKKEKVELFQNKLYEFDKVDPEPEYDLALMFEKCNEDMIAQQAKRDQLISLFLAIFSFVVPFALSMEGVTAPFKGLIFLAIAIIGVLFCLVIIRYRLYKESYWLACRTLTTLMGFKKHEIDKQTVQAVYYQCMKKNFKHLEEKDDVPPRFLWKEFYKGTLFSGETILYIVEAFLTALTAGLSILLFCAGFGIWQFVLAGLTILLTFIWLLNMFLSELLHVYDVLVDDTDKSFNKTYKRAWHLHMFV